MGETMKPGTLAAMAMVTFGSTVLSGLASGLGGAGLSLVTRQGQRIEIATDFDPGTLQRLLAVLEATS